MRALIIATTVAAGLSSSGAFAQQPNQGTASIPDFSGVWSHLSLPSFEPPSAGPGPLINKSRLRQIFDADGRRLPAASGAFASNFNQLVGDYTNPILKPQAAEVVKRHGEIELSGMQAPNPRNQCWPEGVPFVFMNLAMQMLQQPGKITILYDYDHEVRHVRMNESHPAQVTPSWFGDSVGHYDGETLVIDTVGIKADRPFAMIDQYGTPYTQALHVVERYRLPDYEAAKEAEEWGERENFRIPASDTGFARNPNYRGKGLLLQLTVEDERAFTRPWSATITYRRPLISFGEWPELVCAESARVYFPEKKVAIPTADKPDF
jgi:hypothetical protein